MPRAVWLGAGAICGALLASLLPGVAVGLAGAATAAVSAFAGWRTRRRRAALLSLGAALILLRAGIGWAAAGPAPADVPGELGSQHVAWVVSVSAPSGGQQRVVLELEPPAPPERIYAWLPRYPPVAAFDRVTFSGSLDAPPAGEFGDYLARSGIDHVARIRSFELAGSTDTPLAELEHIRRTAADLLARAIPQPQAGLATGLLTGLRDPIARDVAAAFRTAGLSHIVAISGSHLVLIAAFATALLRPLHRRPRSAIVLGLIWAYSVLVGGAPAVMRATLMTTVVVVARESGRAGQAAGGLALTALLMLIVDPAIVGDVGFQLSLAATGGLLAWAGSVADWLRERLPRRVPGLLIEATGMTLAAQLATQPLVLLHFGQLSLVAPLANLLAAPLVVPAMFSSAAAMAAAALAALGVPELVQLPFGMAAAIALGGLIGVADFCARLPMASLVLEPPLNVLGAAAALVGVLAAARHRRPRRPDAASQALADRRAREAAGAAPARRRPAAWAAAGAAAIVLVSALVIVGRPDGRLHMTVLDVGQGDSILLAGPRGGRILVDSGPDPDRLLTLLDGRVPAWDRRVDVVVLTHPHEDHVAGLALLLDRYRIGEIAEPGMVGLGPGDAAYRRRLAELGRQTRVLAAGDRLWLDGIAIDVLWPPRGGVPLRPTAGGTDVNNVSIVLSVQFGARRFLLTGDVEEQVDPRLANGPLAVGARYDVLKVAHHGSRSASTSSFLDRLRPSLAVVSAGWGNPYGHPATGTLDRLAAAGAQVLRTDLDGSIDVSTDGHDLLTQVSGGRPLPSRPTALAPPAPGWCPIPRASPGVEARIQYGS